MNFQAKAQLLGAARTSDGGVNLSQGTQIDVVIKSLREKLESENGVMNAFHALDVDNSNSLTIDEFGECLKSIGITLPKTHLSAVIARFDANGDGNVSIPEFAAFMLGRQDLKEELRFAPGAEADAPAAPAFRSNTEKGAGLRAARQAAEAAAHADLPYSMTRNDCYDRPLEWGAKPLTPRQHGFVSRMEASVEARRHRAYLNELRKDPRFKPSMLEPPGPKYREVVIDGMHGGPIVKTIHTMKTGLEPKRPFKWGQLGSYY